MAFTYPFSSLLVNPSMGIGATVDLGDFEVAEESFRFPTHTATMEIGVYNTNSYPQGKTTNYGTFNYVFYIDNVEVKRGVVSAGGSLDFSNISVASSAGWAKASRSKSISTPSWDIPTSSIFNSENATSRIAVVTLKSSYRVLGNVNLGSSGSWSTKSALNGTSKIILNVPPTFSYDPVAYDTPWIYAGLTTASVDLDDITAYYGGYITEAKLTIGSQTAILTGDDTDILSSGTLSILLNAVGTFTPTLTVTDSRGQVKTETLESITVLGYVNPSVVLSVDRTDSTGAHDDEGTYAVVTGTFTFTDAIATLSQPTVSVSGLPSPTVTWYETRSSAGALSNPVDWNDTSSYTTGKVLYGLIGTLQPNESYVITVTPNDSEGTGTAMSITLATAFYTVDFLAGGHGIAFGKPATQQDLFECDLDAQFNKDVSIGRKLTVTEQTSTENLLLQLDTSGASGTVDDDIYAALVALGWDTDVIV